MVCRLAADGDVSPGRGRGAWEYVADRDGGENENEVVLLVYLLVTSQASSGQLVVGTAQALIA